MLGDLTAEQALGDDPYHAGAGIGVHRHASGCG
jgi:hypothetical protein